MDAGSIIAITFFYLILVSLLAPAVLAKRKTVRIIAAVACLGWSALTMTVANWVQSVNHNVWYSDAAYRMLEAYIQGIEAGRQDSVLREMKRMTNQLQVTYEDRGNFRELAERAAVSLANTNTEPDGAANRGQPAGLQTNRTPSAAGPGG